MVRCQYISVGLTDIVNRFKQGNALLKYKMLEYKKNENTWNT